MNDDEILTPEQVEQLTTGLGAILPAAEIYKLGYKSRNAEIASLRAELADESPGTPLGRLNAIAVATEARGLCSGVPGQSAAEVLMGV